MLARADTDDCPRPRRGVMPGWTVVFVSALPKRLRSPVVLNSGARRTFQIKRSETPVLAVTPVPRARLPNCEQSTGGITILKQHAVKTPGSPSREKPASE